MLIILYKTQLLYINFSRYVCLDIYIPTPEPTYTAYINCT